MPRLVDKTNATRRRTTVTRDRIRQAFVWRDPYPEVPGTIPEKMLFARFMLIQIPFIFQGYTTVNIPELDILKDYRPDFIVPDIKLIIQVQGAYWHSKPTAIEQDAYVQALYETMGFRVANWWDYEIEGNMDALFANDPQLNVYVGQHGGRVIQSGKQSYRDDVKGIRTLNAKRRQYKNPLASRRKIRKAIGSYAT